MKVLVLGSGVIGVTTAWYLARAGHEVTVVDRLETPATETSYANAGMLSFDYSTPWGAPGVPPEGDQVDAAGYLPALLQSGPTGRPGESAGC